MAGDKLSHDFCRAIVNGDRKLMIRNIQGQISPHDGQADEADVCFALSRHVGCPSHLVIAKSSTRDFADVTR
jgi:hypothetical protein